MVKQMNVSAAAPLVVACAALLGGCGTLQTFDGFKPDELSRADEDRFVVLLVPSTNASAKDFEALRPVLEMDSQLAHELSAAGCATAPIQAGQSPTFVAKAIPALLLELISAGVQFAFERSIEQRKQALEDLVDAASASYGATLHVQPEDLATNRCVVMVRFKAPDAEARRSLAAANGTAPATPRAGYSGVFTLNALKPVGSAGVLQLTPRYVRFGNAIAVTKARTAQAAAVIDVAVALSIKAVDTSARTLPSLKDSGVGSVSLTGIALGVTPGFVCKPGQGAIDDRCVRSDLIPYPLKSGTLSMTFGVAEQGRLGFNAKRASAELDAIKAAFGPALSQGIKDQLGK